jgi:predicted  nucleic acid-binding Zn-ribbon protein
MSFRERLEGALDSEFGGNNENWRKAMETATGRRFITQEEYAAIESLKEELARQQRRADQLAALLERSEAGIERGIDVADKFKTLNETMAARKTKKTMWLIGASLVFVVTAVIGLILISARKK